MRTFCLVDDDAVFHLVTKSIMKSAGHEAHLKTFYNGRDAIEFLKISRDDEHTLPDIILLDLFMPIMDGWQFLDEFANVRPHLEKEIAIYVVSSSIDPADIEKARSLSDVTDYIVKPLTSEKFERLASSIQDE